MQDSYCLYVQSLKYLILVLWSTYGWRHLHCARKHCLQNITICIPLPLPQALRYPYFQVGQILGPRPQSQEVKKVQARPPAQKQTSEPKPDPQQSSPESKASTDSTRNQQQHHHHQPLQQIPLPQTESKPGGLSHAVSVFMQIRTIFIVFYVQ